MYKAVTCFTNKVLQLTSILLGENWRRQGLIVFIYTVPFAVAAVDLLSTTGASPYNSDTAAGDSIVEVVSANGRYVLFSSLAKDLASQSNSVPYSWPGRQTMNVYLRDRMLGTTR